MDWLIETQTKTAKRENPEIQYCRACAPTTSVFYRKSDLDLFGRRLWHVISKPPKRVEGGMTPTVLGFQTRLENENVELSKVWTYKTSTFWVHVSPFPVFLSSMPCRCPLYPFILPGGVCSWHPQRGPGHSLWWKKRLCVFSVKGLCHMVDLIAVTKLLLRIVLAGALATSTRVVYLGAGRSVA